LVHRPRRAATLVGRSANDPEALADLKPWLIWLVSFGIWSLITVAGTATISGFYRSTGRGMGFFDTLLPECGQTLPYALLTPFFFGFATRHPVRRDNWIRRSIQYLALGLVFSLLHVTIRAMTPYAFWESKSSAWHSALWNYETHSFTVRWRVIGNLFLMNVVDDVSGAFLPIGLTAHMISAFHA
jgi:hypothetical protein